MSLAPRSVTKFWLPLSASLPGAIPAAFSPLATTTTASSLACHALTEFTANDTAANDRRFSQLIPSQTPLTLVVEKPILHEAP